MRREGTWHGKVGNVEETTNPSERELFGTELVKRHDEIDIERERKNMYETGRKNSCMERKDM
jgi:hypothetical protein